MNMMKARSAKQKEDQDKTDRAAKHIFESRVKSQEAANIAFNFVADSAANKSNTVWCSIKSCSQASTCVLCEHDGCTRRHRSFCDLHKSHVDQ